MSSTGNPLAPTTAPSSDPPPSQTDEEKHIAAVIKRIEGCLQASRSNGARRSRKGRTDENDSGKTDSDATYSGLTYRSYGRNLARTCGPLVRIQPIVEYAVVTELADPDADEAPTPTRDEVRKLESFKILSATIPKFGEDMIDLGGHKKLRNMVCAEIQDGLGGARSDDTSTLKGTVIEYLMPPPPPSVPREPPAEPTLLSPPLSRTGSKAGHGWMHPRTAELLCPLKYMANPETYTKIRDGELSVTGLMMPRFMYRDGHAYDENDLDAGFLEGHTFRAAMKQIYQGPSAALQADGYNRGKAGNAALNGISALTPRDVAYVAIQLRFALSSVQNWSTSDGDFSYSDFYWNVVDSLSGEEGAEIIQRLNFNVFGTREASKRSAPAESEGDNDFDRLAAQRAAKRARKEADSQAAATATTAAAAATAAAATATTATAAADAVNPAADATNTVPAVST
ncbi:hypothetical protein C8J57DRAFT_1493280 [Mycena rebaudengoi]|nr:hypothetical protein C8J57DRAFT_1493280 [Mycena rebaudengoi]